MTDGPRPPAGDEPREPDPMLGRALADRYRVESLIARGGMARVYRARDQRLDRDVAVKVLAPPYSDNPEFSERFLGEARAAASLSHPSLVHVYDSGSDGAAHYIVMELLDRHRTLREVLREGGALPADEVVRMGRELLAGLRVVHERGLVHCDVKPANVMLGPGPAKLIDFGIAQPPHDGLEGDTSIGTLQSMSPEQLRGEALTPASDLFSLGTVLYEALTGRAPYPGTNPRELSEAHAAGSVRPPSAVVPGLTDRLDGIILQSLRRDAASRFHSAVAMANALESASGEPEAADDETRVVPAVHDGPEPAPPSAAAGYVPPPVPDQPMPPPSAPVSEASQPAGRPRASRWGTAWTLAVLAAAALVVILVVIPLVDLGGGGGAGDGSAPPSAAAPTPTIAPNVVPNTIGMPTDEAIALAEAAGLNWTVRCAEDASQPEGIIDQEPPPGTEVAPGSQFTMFSARIDDCS